LDAGVIGFLGEAAATGSGTVGRERLKLDGLTLQRF